MTKPGAELFDAIRRDHHARGLRAAPRPPTPAHHVVKTWRMVSRGPLASINIRPTNSGKAADKLTTAGQPADWLAQQPPGALVVARYSDAGLITESHRDHHLPPWEHLVVEEAHRTVEGITGSDHPHAVIHYDNGILAYQRVYLTATPRIPSELAGPATAGPRSPGLWTYPPSRSSAPTTPAWTAQNSWTTDDRSRPHAAGMPGPGSP